MNGVNFINALILTVMAGLATSIGGLISILFKKINDAYIAFMMSLSAGVMIYISFMEILPLSISSISIYSQNSSYCLAAIIFFSGIGLMAFIHNFIDDSPNMFANNLSPSEVKKKQVLLIGIITSVGIVVHNIPEGMAAFISSAYDINSGFIIVLAISLHNIPEGLCIAAAIYYSTGNKKKALLASFLSGMAEPLGGILAFILFKEHLNAFTMSIIYAIAAGIMVYIALEELLVNARKYAGSRLCLLGWITGMIIISFALML